MIRPYQRMLVIAFAAALLAVLAGLISAAATHSAAAPANFRVPTPTPVCPTGHAYVNHAATGGSNTGDSWADAFISLQAALNATCASFTEIWVAQGVYRPGIAPEDRFTIHPGMSLYGGFAGTEAARDDRNWESNVTVLSGDIAGDDITDANGVITTTANIQNNNSYHVVWMDGKTTGAMDGSTRLDGFVITGGKGSGTNDPDGIGGGVYCDGFNGGTCSPTIANVIFSGNQSGRAAAMYNNGYGNGSTASPILTNVTFTGNTATLDGGALFNGGGFRGKSSPTLTNVTFTGNRSAYGGGAMADVGSSFGDSSPSLTNVVFFNNSAGANGGALFNNGGYSGKSSPSLTNVTFYSNTSATRGGAIYNLVEDSGVAAETLTNAILWGNTAAQGDDQIGDSNAASTVNYSVVQGGWTGAGGSNSAEDPLFADAATGNLNLLPGSPAIDGGTDSIGAGAPATDIRDLSRPVNTFYDMGAYEARGFDLAITGGNPQTTGAGAPFGTRLGVQVTSSHDERVGPGSILVFTPPPSGPGLSSSTPFTVTTDDTGAGSTSAAANALAGSYQVTVTARGVVTPVTFTLTNTVQPLPVAVNDAAGTLEDTPVTVAVLGNDSDPAGGGLKISAITLIPAHGTVVLTATNTAVLYTPDAGFSGLDSFLYVAQDVNGRTDDALATVVVSPKNQVTEPPQITPVNPQLQNTTPFTSPNGTVGVQLPAGFFTTTLEEKDILFLSYTPVLTPTGETLSPPDNLTFGNFQFDMTLFLNNEPQHGTQFAQPITVTVNYSSTIMGGLNEGTLGVYYWGGSSWNTAGISILDRDLLHHRITIALAHLSEFAFFVQRAPTALDPGAEPQRNTTLFLPRVMR